MELIAYTPYYVSASGTLLHLILFIGLPLFFAFLFGVFIHSLYIRPAALKESLKIAAESLVQRSLDEKEAEELLQLYYNTPGDFRRKVYKALKDWSAKDIKARVGNE